MDKQRKLKLVKALNVLVILAVVGIFAYLLYSALVLKTFPSFYGPMMCIALAVFWALNDVAAPLLREDFKGKTPEQMDAYRKFAAAELAGYAGLGYFASTVESQTGIYGAVVFAATMMMKRKFHNVYLGLNEDGTPITETKEKTEE